MATVTFALRVRTRWKLQNLQKPDAGGGEPVVHPGDRLFATIFDVFDASPALDEVFFNGADVAASGSFRGEATLLPAVMFRSVPRVGMPCFHRWFAMGRCLRLEEIDLQV